MSSATLFNRRFLSDNPNWSLAVLRIGVGIMFAIAAYGKVMAGSSWPDRMTGFINRLFPGDQFPVGQGRAVLDAFGQMIPCIFWR